MPFLAHYAETVLFVAGVLVVCGAAVSAWMLFVRGRAEGRPRCPRCWYSMIGARENDQGARQCPECGHGVARERDLYRTRRYWRRAALGLVPMLLGASLAGVVLWREANPWRFAPDIMIIDAIPRMTAGGRLALEFERRKFITGYTPDFVNYNWSYPRIDPEWFRVRQLRGFERRLLARRAAEALESRPNCPFRSELLILLALSGEEKERAYEIVRGMFGTGFGGSDPELGVALLPLVAPDRRAAADFLTAKLFALHEADPNLRDGDQRFAAVRLVEALRTCGPDAAGAVPLLISMLRIADPPYWRLELHDSGFYIPVVEALGRIGPAAHEALLYLGTEDDASGEDSIVKLIAILRISGACTTDEDAAVRALANSSWRTRRAAATHLANAPRIADAARAALVRALDDPSQHVRETAADCLLGHDMERRACHRALLHPAPGTPRFTLWNCVYIMWRHGLDPTDALPQLERELAAEPHSISAPNIRRMIEAIRLGKMFEDARPRKR